MIEKSKTRLGAFTRENAKKSLVQWFLLLSLSPLAVAYPDRPIKIILPFPPGGSVDVVTRLITQEMSTNLGQAIVLDYKPGGAGILATELVSHSPSDGYTLLITTPSHTINPALHATLPFETEKDFETISFLTSIPELLVANVNAPFNNLSELIQFAKTNSQKISYSSAGSGTLPHITMEILARRAGINLLHVPYKGAAPAFNDLVAGVVDIKYDTYATSSQFLNIKKIKVIATAGVLRLAQLPNTPTIAEQGFDGYQGYLWIGLLAPKNTSSDKIKQLALSVSQAVQTPAVASKLETYGVEFTAKGPQQMKAQIELELKQYKQVVKEAKISEND